MILQRFYALRSAQTDFENTNENFTTYNLYPQKQLCNGNLHTMTSDLLITLNIFMRALVMSILANTNNCIRKTYDV